MVEDGALERLKLGTRFEPAVLDHRVARCAIDLQSVFLATASVQRKHELGAQPLAPRVRTDQRSELGDELEVEPECEVGIDPLFQARET